MRFYITDRIDGVLDTEDSYETYEEAEARIAEYEAEDKAQGCFSEGFYVIIEADPSEVDSE